MKYIITVILSVLCLSGIYAQSNKMSAYVKQAAMAGIYTPQRLLSKGAVEENTPSLTALVQATDEAVLYQHGCRIFAKWDDMTDGILNAIYIAAIPLIEINALVAEEQVLRIEAGKSCTLTNDSAASVTHARDLWKYSPVRSQSGGYTGKDVVVGVMDVGFDLTNPNYYSADGKTYRVKQMWDMLDSTKCGQEVTGPKLSDGYYVGRQYIGFDSLMSKRHSTDSYLQFHGSHTSCTAAGSGAPFACADGDPIYSGMAPEADLCLVSNYVGSDISLIKKDEQYMYSSTATDLLGFKYIFDYADKVGKPCVISFSEGAYEDLYQSGLYNKVVNKMVGPGHILCASAGNEGSTGYYMHKEKGVAQKGSFLIADSSTGLYVLRSTEPPVITLRFYEDEEAVYDWKYDTEKLRHFPDSVFRDTLEIDDMKFLVALNTYPSCYDSTLFATDMWVRDMYGYEINHTPVALILTDEDNDVEAFANGGEFTANSCDIKLSDFTSDHSILFPGCLDSVICIGNACYRNAFTNKNGSTISPWGSFDSGKIFYNSSKGPSMHGNVKPDAVAPGLCIISSFGSYYPITSWWENNISVSDMEYNGRTYHWVAETGTSMATPVASGVIALWLQACPTLSPTDIREVIAHSSSHYDESMTWPNNTYGYGEIDAKAGIEYIHKNYFSATDVNKDGTTNVSDVSAVIATICSDKSYAPYADVNNDGAVNVADVSSVITTICKAE